MEIATASPGARLVFADLGWAGWRGQTVTARSLVGIGAGVSLLDGLLRIDLRRALHAPVGWRLDAYIDGSLYAVSGAPAENPRHTRPAALRSRNVSPAASARHVRGERRIGHPLPGANQLSGR